MLWGLSMFPEPHTQPTKRLTPADLAIETANGQPLMLVLDPDRGRKAGDSSPEDVYDRFTTAQKRLFTAVISLAGVIGPSASACFVPSVPEVAKDLNTTGTMINYTVGIYMFMFAVGNLIWAPYAGFYGRQPVYLTSLPLVCVGSLGAAMSRNVIQLVLSRTVLALGASCVMAVGAATISDIYRLEERGTAMGMFFGTALLGPALSPFIGGFLATYASWRIMQLLLSFIGLVAFICVAYFLPETSHPGSRGVDSLLGQEAEAGFGLSTKKRGWKMVWLNPFTSLSLLRGPVILFVALTAAFTLTTFYVLTIPLSYTLGPRYGITSPVLIGACSIPSGLGNMVGATIAGRLSDRAVIKGRQHREGRQWVPEDRLRATIPGALILLPLSLLVFGLTTELIPGNLGLVINLTCLFINGTGVDMVLAPSATYYVDILHTQSAEAMAVYSAFRNVFCAVAAAGVLPLINQIGIGATNGLTAILALFAFGLLWITIQYGGKLRAWRDIGYTISDKNLD